jgi:CheY-like chemotaxis protein
MNQRHVVLYVDDSENIAFLVKRFFEKKYPSYEVLLAASAAIAWEQILARRGTPEFPRAIITDFRLGASTDGPTLVEMVRAEFPELRAIIVSGTLAPRDLERAYAAGADAAIEKDLNAQKFADQLFELTDCSTDTLQKLYRSPSSSQGA